jgi:hypothetical protein
MFTFLSNKAVLQYPIYRHWMTLRVLIQHGVDNMDFVSKNFHHLDVH